MLTIKPGTLLKYKCSPDRIFVKVIRVMSRTDDKVVFLGRFYGIYQEWVITKDSEKCWEESV